MSPIELGAFLRKLKDEQIQVNETPSHQNLYDEWKLLIELSKETNVRKIKVRNMISRIIPEHRPRATPKITERAIAMSDLYRQGKTLREIASKFSVSHQYVYQTLRRMGLTSKDGGAAMRPKKRDLICKAVDCDNPVKTAGYCGKHYARVRIHGTTAIVYKYKFQIHDGSCLVNGCDKQFVSNGLCNKHRTNFYINKREGNISDLNDFLKVQKAKRMLGRTYGLKFEEIRAFMESNKEHFEEDLYKGE